MTLSRRDLFLFLPVLVAGATAQTGTSRALPSKVYHDRQIPYEGDDQKKDRQFSVPSERRVRLALLGSWTMAHSHASIRVAGLRRGLWIDIYESPFGQYWQQLCDPNSGLYRFKPDTVLFSFDAEYLARGAEVTQSKAEAGAAPTEGREPRRTMLAACA